MRNLLAFLFIVLSVISGLSQTCCSSGVPIASNLGFQPQGGNVLQLSLAYEYNRLTSLYNESVVLDDDRRLRTTNTALFRAAYGLHKRVDLEILLPYVRQLREVTLNSGEKERDGGQGIADATLLTQITVVENQFASFSIAGGIKLPTGANDLRNRLGFLLVNDLQLGSNSIDYLARIAFVRNLSMRPSVSLFFNSTAIFRGANDEYLGSQKYKFGNEIQANLGYSDQAFLWKTLVYPSLSLRFRHAVRDEVNDNSLENTGGSWLFGRASFGVDLYKGNRLSIAGEYPLFTKVDGTQLSPDYIINFSYYKAIDFSKQSF